MAMEQGAAARVQTSDRVSFSQLQQFEACPRQYFFKKVLGLAEVQSKEAVLGNVVHDLAAATMLGQPSEEVNRRAEELVAAQPLLDLDQDLPQVLHMLQACRRYKPLKPDAERQVEQWLEVEVDGIQVVMKADLIESTPERVRITDWKTSFKVFGLDETQQLDVYALCLAHQAGSRPIEVALRFLRYGERKGLLQRESSVEDRERVLTWIRHLVARIDAAQRLPWRVGFPATPGRSCTACPFAVQCLLSRAQEFDVAEAGGLDLMKAVYEAALTEPADETAGKELGGWLLILERALEITRGWLRTYVEQHGGFDLGGRVFNLYFRTSLACRDMAGFFAALKTTLAEHGDDDPWQYLKIDTTKAKKLFATPLGQELRAEYWEEFAEPYFAHRSAQADEAGA